jgi:two-component system C4-dicarboxylate transport response regulator DctD
MRRSVAIIDPDINTQRLLGPTLRLAGLDIVSFANAELFLAQDPQDIACVVLEQALPGMQGLELLAQLRAQDFDLPVVMVASHAEIDLAVDAIRLGANDFIDKSRIDVALPRRLAQYFATRQPRPRVAQQ